MKSSRKRRRKPLVRRNKSRVTKNPAVTAKATGAEHLARKLPYVDLTFVDLEPPPADRNEYERRLKARVEQLEQLGFDAAWPSVFLPLRTDVRELLGRVRRILEEHGFQVRDVPDGLFNPLGDGRTWVVRCVPSARLSPGQDLADLARRALESGGVRVAARPTWDDGTLLIPLYEVSTQTKLPHKGGLRDKILGDPNGTVRNAEAAEYFDVKPKTIRRWKHEGRLMDGAKRGTVTNLSILALESKLKSPK